MYFASHFPHLINSIVLLGPAGLLRRMPAGYDSIFFKYPFFVPASYIRKLVGNILEVDQSEGPIKIDHTARKRVLEAGGLPEPKALNPEDLDVAGIVQWQFDNHQGFVHTFADTIRYGPLMNQRSAWEKACSIIRGEGTPLPSGKLYGSKILAIFGDVDNVVVPSETTEDLKQLLGEEHLVTKIVPGGHGFPVPSTSLVIKHILEFWHLD